MRYLTLFLVFFILTACGGGGGSSGGSSSGGGGSTPLSSIDKAGDLVPLSTTGIFAGSETNTTITVWQGARLGEVTFHSTTLGTSFTGRDGSTFSVARPGGFTWTFAIVYDPGAHLLRFERPSDTTHRATWTIIEPPSGPG